MHLSKFLLPLIPLLVSANSAPAPQASGILADLPGIVDGVKDLLSQDTIDDLQTIVKGGATLLGGDTPQNLKNLLSKDNLDQLQDIINNAHMLLTKDFVNNTGTLIDDATPLVADVSKLFGALLSSLF